MMNSLFYFYRSTPSLSKIIRKLKKCCTLELHHDFSCRIFKEHSTFGKILHINIVGLDWKDKYGTPRWEGGLSSVYNYPAPCINIILFSKIKLTLRWFFDPAYDEDSIFEQFIWIYFYCKGDIDAARRKWPWTTIPEHGEQEKSTWLDIFKNN